MNLESLRTRVQDKAADRRNLVQAIATRELSIQTATEDVAAMEEAQALAQRTATETQEQLRFHLEDLVQHALDSIFPGRYKFRIRFEVVRGKTAADVFLEAESGFARDPMDETGGTVLQVFAFALRIAAWTLSRTDNTILLDEPFKDVSGDLRSICGELLVGLVRDLGLQFIVVATHETGPSWIIDYADRLFPVSLDDKGRSQITMREGAKNA